jgi:uroporphyrin-III C-methyltransferase
MTSRSSQPGHICFVGAGPGDPELLTLRAADRLRTADLILRDILVPDELIAATGARAQVVNVGRLCGGEETQEARLARIHAWLIEGYREGRRIVRLKSGDPFIFGRAVEELQRLIEADIPFECVPGITAGIAAANLAQIPLTERYTSPSVLFCTGQTAGGGTDRIEAWASLLRGGTTLVLYMGLKALAHIAPRLQSAVPADEIHVSAISQVSAPGQLVVHAPLSRVEATLSERPLPLPVVFILGLHAQPLAERLAQPLAPCANHE